MFVRHGQSGGNVGGTFGGHSDTPLSGLGKKQAETTAEMFYRHGVDALYSSDLPRAVQTALPIAQACNIELNKTNAFRERDVGVLEGLTFDESREKHPSDYYPLVGRDINHKITNGESYRDLLQRATAALNEVIRTHQGRKIVIVSHTGAICYLTLHLMGAITKQTKTTPWLVTSNCGINRFEIRGKNNVRVVALNDTRHLERMTGNDSFTSQ